MEAHQILLSHWTIRNISWLLGSNAFGTCSVLFFGSMWIWNRALKAEVETLKRESETAREKFMDRTEDAQRFQLLLEMQRKENQRLRGTLEEWSRRNAKLESRLNKALDKRPKSDRPSSSQGGG